MSEQTKKKIWRAVDSIPYGTVVSYGEVARRAGLPRRARLVGHALKSAPDDRPLPWHRVIRADGTIAFPSGSKQHKLQVSRLRAEGIVVTGGRVQRETGEADLDEWLWGPVGGK